MRRFGCLALALAALISAPAGAQQLAYGEAAGLGPLSTQVATVTEVVEEEIVEEAGGAAAGSGRFVASSPVSGLAALPRGVARYGPFRVLDAGRAALVGPTDERSPAQFLAMLAAHPAIATLELVECPGTEDDRANLRLGRLIRARGLATHVPDGGSVRSGAVELFLAGVRHRAEAGAEFAVHAWADEDGREATDYPASAPENRAYIAYYREMGMSPAEAAAFYAMTNSVPNAQARWLTAAEMGQWVRQD
ncbi:alpha/beta hydrolase [Novosphingobium bradum]|uniref:Alpha/beta hydrolase n=1 Tax=Novosphingobium bradum TaxID=1737444 RepID=A0ABV7IML0_9SPHN